MTQQKIDFGKLAELREKDEKLFEAAVDLLLSIGYANITDERVIEVLEEINEKLEAEKVSVDEMFLLIIEMLVICAALEIREVSLETLLDYIAENGWRRHEKPGC